MCEFEKNVQWHLAKTNSSVCGMCIQQHTSNVNFFRFSLCQPRQDQRKKKL